MMIPKKLRNAAIKAKANVGRVYDAQGKHIAYYLRVSPDWLVYRGTVEGMIALLRCSSNQPGICE